MKRYLIYQIDKPLIDQQYTREEIWNSLKNNQTLVPDETFDKIEASFDDKERFAKFFYTVLDFNHDDICIIYDILDL